MMNPEKAKNIYWGAMPLPAGAKSLGEYVDDNRRGCLIELRNGVKVVGNAGGIQNIPGVDDKAKLTADRTKLGLTQKVMADCLGLSSRTYEKYENGQNKVTGPVKAGVALMLKYKGAVQYLLGQYT
jgi:DNA-binding XRE family transcriptional regulator